MQSGLALRLLFITWSLLLDIDRLDKNWEHGVRSDWEMMNSSANDNFIQPFAITRLNRNFTAESIDGGLIIDGHDDAATHMSRRCAKYTTDGKIIVSKMPLKLFRECLIEHFDIRFKSNSIVWPRRFNKPNY